MCEDLNNFFSSAFVTNPEKISLYTTMLPNCPLMLEIGLVKIALKRLKKSTLGIDQLPYWIFKEAAEDLAPAVTSLFNWSLSSVKVPALYKHANVTPIQKCSKPEKSDYWPI